MGCVQRRRRRYARGAGTKRDFALWISRLGPDGGGPRREEPDVVQRDGWNRDFVAGWAHAAAESCEWIDLGRFKPVDGNTGRSRRQLSDCDVAWIVEVQAGWRDEKRGSSESSIDHRVAWRNGTQREPEVVRRFNGRVADGALFAGGVG